MANHKKTEAEVCEAIANILKYAPDKAGGGGRSKKMAMND